MKPALFLVSLLFTKALSVTEETSDDTESQIISGQDALKDQFPYQVALRILFDGSTGFCSGSLISCKTVLTAAHCLRNAQEVQLIFGALNVEESEKTQEIVKSKKFLIHPKHDQEKFQNDVALIYLEKCVKLSDSIKLVKLAQGNCSYTGCKATVAGWGATSDEEATTTDHLKFLENYVISNTECRQTKPYEDVIRSVHLCLTGKGHKGTCVGDSGGPLVCNSDGKQIGIVSFGSTHCEDGKPSVFTRVTKYYDWIQENMSK